MDLKTMRRMSAAISGNNDELAERVCDSVSNWDEPQQMFFMGKLRGLVMCEDAELLDRLRNMEPETAQAIMAFALLGYQNTIVRILDKDIFLEEQADG